MPVATWPAFLPSGVGPAGTGTGSGSGTPPSAAAAAAPTMMICPLWVRDLGFTGGPPGAPPGTLPLDHGSKVLLLPPFCCGPRLGETPESGVLPPPFWLLDCTYFAVAAAAAAAVPPMAAAGAAAGAGAPLAGDMSALGIGAALARSEDWPPNSTSSPNLCPPLMLCAFFWAAAASTAGSRSSGALRFRRQ